MLRQMVGSPSPSQSPEPTPLPEIIYVQYDEGGEYFTADTDLSNSSFEEREVGIYELKETKKIKVKIVLE